MHERSDPGRVDGRRARVPALHVVVTPGNHCMRLKAWAMAAEVKQRLHVVTGCRFSLMRLFHGPTELHNSQLLLELLECRRHHQVRSRSSPVSSHRTLKLSLKVQNPHDFSNGTYVAPWGGVDTATIGRAGERLLERVGQGICQGFSPSLAIEGMGGTYVLRDAKRRPVAAFKPRDEEPFAPNNPRGLSGKMGQPGIHPAIPSGESHLREVLAYLLDHRGFAAVPPTIQAEALHPAFHVQSMRPLSRYGAKVGSLQAWVSHADLASDIGVSNFPAHEVHKLAILDMRLLNTDRNDGNVLVTRSKPRDSARGQVGERHAERQSERSSAGADDVDSADAPQREGNVGTEKLVPIDHGGMLPTLPQVVWYNWCWLSWPQMNERLSSDAVEYVCSLDPLADSRSILDAGLSPVCARVCRCATTTLVRGVQSGLGLLDIAHMLSRQDEECPSDLENLWSQAERLAHSAIRNHRLRGVGPSASLPDDDESRSPTSVAGGGAAMRRAVSYSAVEDVCVAEERADACVTAAASGEGSSAHAVPRNPKASEHKDQTQPAQAATVAVGPAMAITIPIRHTEGQGVALESAMGAPDGGAASSPGELSRSPVETVSQLPELPSPSLSRRSLGVLPRRVASFSTLIGLDEGVDPTSGSELGGIDGGRPRLTTSGKGDVEEEVAFEPLFFTYFERLLVDTIKRVATRKRMRPPQCADKERQPGPLHRDKPREETQAGKQQQKQQQQQQMQMQMPQQMQQQLQQEQEQEEHETRDEETAAQEPIVLEPTHGLPELMDTAGRRLGIFASGSIAWADAEDEDDAEGHDLSGCTGHSPSTADRNDGNEEVPHASPDGYKQLSESREGVDAAASASA